MNADKIVKQAKADAPKVALNLDLKYTKQGIQALPTYKNALIYINNDPNLIDLFKYNEFSSHTEFSSKPNWGIYGDYPREVNDFDVLALKTYLIDTYSVEFSVGILNEAIDHQSTKSSYNPVKNYLKSLKWDGKPRINNWLTTYLGVDDNKYTSTVGSIVLKAACARIERPGIKFDYMMILEGDQGIGKSFACRILGGQWYREVSLVERTKETIEKIQGAWIIEVPELAVFKKKDIESLKAFISNEVDMERLPYGHRSLKFPRRNVFIGTINPDNNGYLSDTTGNRRFLPVECRKVDLSGLTRDRDQIWAEAWQESLKGDALYLNKEIENLAISEQGGRQIVDEWVECVEEYVKNKDRATSIEIWQEALRGHPNSFDRLSQSRIANCLRKLGWKRKVFRNELGQAKSGFVSKDYSPNKHISTVDPEKPWE